MPELIADVAFDRLRQASPRDAAEARALAQRVVERRPRPSAEESHVF